MHLMSVCKSQAFIGIKLSKGQNIGFVNSKKENDEKGTYFTDTLLFSMFFHGMQTD